MCILCRQAQCSRARLGVAAQDDGQHVVLCAGASATGAGGGSGDAAYDLARGGAAALLDELQERALWARYGL